MPNPAKGEGGDASADVSELAALVAPLWSAGHTREVLGLSQQAMLDRARAGSLLALTTSDGAVFYPVWQFEKREGNVQVKPGLRKFVTVLRDHDQWTVAVLIKTPAAELADKSPLDWVCDGGDTTTLVTYAERLRTEFTR